MKEELVSVPTPDGLMNLHVFFPDSSGSTPVPAIVIFQEAFGVNGNMKEICRKFANEGYLAVAPELFHRVGNNLEFAYNDTPRVMSTLSSITNEDLIEDAKAAFDYIKNLKNISVGPIGAIGFCMGGFTSILSACHLPLQFAISCYGGGISNERAGIGFMPFLNEFKNIECPVFLLYGEKDHSIPPDQIEIIRGQLKRDQKEYEIKIYLGAGHAFLREGQPVYHPSAAPEAWKDIFSWLKQHKSC